MITRTFSDGDDDGAGDTERCERARRDGWEDTPATSEAEMSDAAETDMMESERLLSASCSAVEALKALTTSSVRQTDCGLLCLLTGGARVRPSSSSVELKLRLRPWRGDSGDCGVRPGEEGWEALDDGDDGGSGDEEVTSVDSPLKRTAGRSMLSAEAGRCRDELMGLEGERRVRGADGGRVGSALPFRSEAGERGGGGEGGGGEPLAEVERERVVMADFSAGLSRGFSFGMWDSDILSAVTKRD
jgi:hypothetical protein